MSNLLNIIRKEVKELLTLKALLPIIAFTLMFALIGQSMSQVSDGAKEKPIVGIIDLDNSTYSQEIVSVFKNNSRLKFFSHDISKKQDAISELRNKKGACLLVIPDGFGENVSRQNISNIRANYIIEGLGLMDSAPSAGVNSIIQAASHRISIGLLKETRYKPEIILQPVSKKESTYLRGRHFSNMNPMQLGAILSSQSTMVPMIIMIILLMSGAQVIQSMGLEKGNKTLETLLTLPVKRSHVALGKIIGAAIVGLIMASIYMAGFGYYMQSFQPEIMGATDANLTLGLMDYALVGISLFLSILAGLSICLLLGSFAKDYKSSQALMFPLIILVFIPFFLTMYKSFFTMQQTLQVIIFLIPFSHPMMAINFLMFGNYLMVVSGIMYLIIFTSILITIVTRVFKSDTLITGRFGIPILDNLFNRNP